MRSTPLLLLLAAAAVGFGTYRLSLLSNVSSSVPIVKLNMDPERGVVWDINPQVVKLPPRRLDLTCYLPPDSGEGTYGVFLRRPGGALLLDAGGFPMKRQRFGPSLEFKLDLRNVEAGNYMLEILRPGGATLRYQVRIST